MSVESGCNRSVLEGPVLGDIHDDEGQALLTNVANGKRFPYIEVRECSLGRGVFTVAAVPKGKLLLKFEGEYMSFQEQCQMDDEANSLQIGEDLYINTKAPAVYTNHSCHPNCYIDSGLWLVAARRIETGEELTFDYSTTMLERHWHMEGCQCGSVVCRGTIRDFDMLSVETQDWYLRQGWVMEHVLRHRTLKLSLTMEVGQTDSLPAMRRYSATGSENRSGL
jgi:hypothetical protein